MIKNIRSTQKLGIKLLTKNNNNVKQEALISPKNKAVESDKCTMRCFPIMNKMFQIELNIGFQFQVEKGQNKVIVIN